MRSQNVIRLHSIHYLDVFLLFKIFLTIICSRIAYANKLFCVHVLARHHQQSASLLTVGWIHLRPVCPSSFSGIISYQLQTFPLGPVLQSHAPEQHAAARHNWGWYRSLTATNLKSFKPHPSRLLSLSSISSLRPYVCVRTWSSTKWESVTAVAPSTPRSLQFSQTKTDSGVYAADALMLHWG